MYFKYLSAAFGSAMITSVYSIVDMAMVGQYQGPDGTGGIGGRRSGLEHHLQSWPFDGHRRQRDFQYKARQREMRRE